MGKSLDSEKLIAWQQRLVKFEASGLSVAAFCRQEEISAATFYYWSRRVRENGVATDVERTDVHASVGERPSKLACTVEVAIGEHVKVRLPSHDHGLVHSVLASLRSTPAAPNALGAFQRVVLR